MTVVGGAADALSKLEHRVQLRRAVIASTIGTTIEWYDFFLYSTVTGLVFAKLYFPELDPLVGTLQAFGIYAVGFVARPVGAAIFGHYGDRIGRKAALIATLLLMGIATFLVAFVPTYAQIGIWGAIILTILRFIQGVGVGGEWGGSVLLSMEWARSDHHRGFIAAWPQFGVPGRAVPGEFGGAGIQPNRRQSVPRLGMAHPVLPQHHPGRDRPLYPARHSRDADLCALVAENRVEKTPALEVIRRQPKEILLTALARMGEQAPFYIFTAFVFTYGTTILGVSRDLPSHSGVDRLGRVVLLDPVFGSSVGQDRPQADVSDRRGGNRSVWFHLLRAAQYDGARVDLSRHRAVTDPARHDVRPASGIDRRMLYRPAALQRRLDRLSDGPSSR